jgi:DNA-directed RNA polymerase subunit H (RpoH/RPB5)
MNPPSDPSPDEKVTPILPSQSFSFKTIENCHNNAIVMLTDRGYTIVPKSNWSHELRSFKDLKIVAHSHSDKLFVYFATDSKVLVRKMKDYIEHMKANVIQHAIIVYSSQITPSAKGGIPPEFDIELFEASELFFNYVKEHMLNTIQLNYNKDIKSGTNDTTIQKYEKLSEEQVHHLLKKYHLTSKKFLPKYNVLDPVVRYYHWPIGSIIKILRKIDPKKDPEIYYRCVEK